MDNENYYSLEEALFMKEKSLNVVNKNNNLNLNIDDVEFDFHKLDGISNKIFKISIKPKNHENCYYLFFKIFGKISSNKNFYILL